MPLLWQFNLHYFHYLYLLAPTERVSICKSWIKQNPIGIGVGWHAYPLSLRIVNWCKTDPVDPEIQASLYAQACYLYRNLETYVYGNHLLENARALVLAGSFFNGCGESVLWLKKGLEIYCKESSIQILRDGGHYERSPMYHALLLEGYLDVLNCISPNCPEYEGLVQIVRRMSGALSSLTHPDGHVALFNDATQEIAAPTEAIHTHVEDLTGYVPEMTQSLTEMGYFIYGDDEIYLIIDGGEVGPDHLLAHAHADVLSYELSVNEVQFIVDSGVYEYKAGVMRDYVRSTNAHNTVQIDGVNQIECWNSFRVARRFAPHSVKFLNARNGAYFTGSFSGYGALVGDGVQHTRSVTVNRGQRLILIEDHIEGRGSHRVESRIRFHPEVEIIETGEEIVLKRCEATCSLVVNDERFRWEESWYCPRFGIRQRNKVLVLGGRSNLPIQIEYSFRY